MSKEETNTETNTAGHEATAYGIPVYRVALVREGEVIGRTRPRLDKPEQAAALLAAYLEGADREQVVVILVDAQYQPIGINTVSIGTLDAALVHPREVFKPAILANAHAVIVGHNHISGDPEPSPHDEMVTQQLYIAAEILGIPLLDSIIIGEAGQCFSFAKADRLPEGTKEKLASLLLEQ